MLSRLKNTFRQTSHKLIAGALALVIIAVPVAALAYGPQRPTFDWNTPEGVRGSTTGPVFNSFTNIPGYGDERNFVRLSEAVDANPIDDSYSDDLTTAAGKAYWVRMYVHNNANPSLNCAPEHRDATGKCLQIDPGSPGIAVNTRVRLDFDKGRANGHDVKGYVSADNAAPQEVWDEGVLRNNDYKFRLEYVPGSAKVLNSAQPNVLRPLSDEIAGANGTQIGYQEMNGAMPGCEEFITRVYVKVVVKAPVIKVTKQAFKSGTQELLDDKTVAPNTPITWKIRFFNIGNDVANDLTVRDELPAGANLEANSLKLYTNNQNGVVQGSENENTFFNQGGLNLGNYAPLTDQEKASDVDSGLLTFKVTIKDDKKSCELVNRVFARVPDDKEVTDDSRVIIDRNGNQPGYGCEEVKPAVAQPKPTARPTPTSLPVTGPGNIAGAFLVTTAAGATAHRIYMSRRYRD